MGGGLKEIHYSSRRLSKLYCVFVDPHLVSKSLELVNRFLVLLLSYELFCSAAVEREECNSTTNVCVFRVLYAKRISRRTKALMLCVVLAARMQHAMASHSVVRIFVFTGIPSKP